MSTDIKARTWLAWAWRRTSRPARLIAAAGLVLAPMANQLAEGEADLPRLDYIAFAVVVLGSGLLGLDRAGGLLSVLLARPMRRSTYVLGRWVGACAVAMMLLVGVLVVDLMLMWALADAPLPWPSEILDWTWRCALTVAAANAVLALASSFVDGIGDAGVLIGGVCLFVLGNEAFGIVQPGHPLFQVAAQSLLFVHPVFVLSTSVAVTITLASNMAISLVLAILVMNRREIQC